MEEKNDRDSDIIVPPSSKRRRTNTTKENDDFDFDGFLKYLSYKLCQGHRKKYLCMGAQLQFFSNLTHMFNI